MTNMMRQPATTITDTVAVLQNEVDCIKAQVDGMQIQNTIHNEALLKLVEKCIDTNDIQTKRINVLEKKLKRRSVLLGITISATVLLIVSFVWSL